MTLVASLVFIMSLLFVLACDCRVRSYQIGGVVLGGRGNQHARKKWCMAMAPPTDSNPQREDGRSIRTMASSRNRVDRPKTKTTRRDKEQAEPEQQQQRGTKREAAVFSTSTRRNRHQNEKDGVPSPPPAVATPTLISPPSSSSSSPLEQPSFALNLSAVSLADLQALIVDGWKYPKFRAHQVLEWIRQKGVTNVEMMTNLPKDLRQRLKLTCQSHALEMVQEWTSKKDGTIKRAYACGNDRQLIESVLMSYTDGRYTACISSQAGCAQKCSFCATGQMGWARQLTTDEIFEQVARFHAFLLQQQQQSSPPPSSTLPHVPTGSASSTSSNTNQRLSNIVFMGMGEPLANYKNVKRAIQRITQELGIGARRITVSTVGIVPMIRILTHDLEMPPVKLAISLHGADDTTRSALIPANARYGGLQELFAALREYIQVTNRRITIEWALIHGQNDDPITARQLGKLLHDQLDRADLVHINVIPLNPTGDYSGQPSSMQSVSTFCEILQEEFRIPCTPRVRRGIDINAGCGQLKATILRQQEQQQQQQRQQQPEEDMKPPQQQLDSPLRPKIMLNQDDHDDHPEEEIIRDFDDDDFVNPEYETTEELAEVQRLISLVENTKL